MTTARCTADLTPLHCPHLPVIASKVLSGPLRHPVRHGDPRPRTGRAGDLCVTRRGRSPSPNGQCRGLCPLPGAWGCPPHQRMGRVGGKNSGRQTEVRKGPVCLERGGHAPPAYFRRSWLGRQADMRDCFERPSRRSAEDLRVTRRGRSRSRPVGECRGLCPLPGAWGCPPHQRIGRVGGKNSARQAVMQDPVCGESQRGGRAPPAYSLKKRRLPGRWPPPQEERRMAQNGSL